MRIQTEDYGLSEFVRILDIDAKAWTVRTYRGETALAFGLSRPVFQNTYGELDLFAAVLSLWIAFSLKIDMARAAELVRDHWREWLDGLTKVERMNKSRVYRDGICFVIAMTADKKTIKAKVGVCEKVFEELVSDDTLPLPIPLDFIANYLRKAAEKAGINLPKYLVQYKPGTEDYATWMTEIETVRRLVATRRVGRKKAKVTA